MAQMSVQLVRQDGPSDEECKEFLWCLGRRLGVGARGDITDVYIDEWVYELLELVQATGRGANRQPERPALRGDRPGALSRFIYPLTQRFSRAGVSPIMTSEVSDLFCRLAEYGISQLSDNVILLQYLRADSRLLRAVTVVKSRASAHDPEIRQFEITSGGIVLGDQIGDEHVLG
jgi:circadian clock protein KaiC